MAGISGCLKSAFAAAGFQPAYQFSYNIAT